MNIYSMNMLILITGLEGSVEINKYTNTQEFPKQVRLTEVKITFIDSDKPKTDPDPSNTKLKVALGQKVR